MATDWCQQKETPVNLHRPLHGRVDPDACDRGDIFWDAQQCRRELLDWRTLGWKCGQRLCRFGLWALCQSPASQDGRVTFNEHRIEQVQVFDPDAADLSHRLIEDDA